MSSDMEDESLSEHNFYSSDSERGRSGESQCFDIIHRLSSFSSFK